MKYLLLAILFSSLFPISLRVGQKFNFNNRTAIIINFFYGCLFSLLLFLVNFPKDYSSHLLFAIFLGIPTGFIYYSGLVLYQQSISKYGLSIAAMFMKIAMMLTVILAIIIYSERPSTYQYVGIFLALCAIIILNGGIKQLKGLTPTLIILFFVSGTGDFINKIYDEAGNPNNLLLFISSTFLVAGLTGLLFDLKIVKKNLKPINFTFGIISGTFNVFSTYFIVKTLDVMNASIAIVIINISIILFVSFVGLLFFKERLKRNEIVAYLISLVAILLISIK